MKLFATILAVGLAAGVAAPALADHHENEPPKVEVLERNDKGQATKVKIGDSIIDVCITENQDNCINPRDAGLDFGNRELSYWPGRPASEIEEPLPWDPPAEPVQEIPPETETEVE